LFLCFFGLGPAFDRAALDQLQQGHLTTLAEKFQSYAMVMHGFSKNFFTASILSVSFQRLARSRANFANSTISIAFFAARLLDRAQHRIYDQAQPWAKLTVSWLGHTQFHAPELIVRFDMSNLMK
jgi:hypothetical protein